MRPFYQSLTGQAKQPNPNYLMWFSKQILKAHIENIYKSERRSDRQQDDRYDRNHLGRSSILFP